MQVDTYIPRRLDDQWKLGLWDADVAFPVLFSILLAWLSSSKMVAAVMVMGGFAASRWVARLKSDKHPAFALHWIYWHLPCTPVTSMKCTPPSEILRMVG